MRAARRRPLALSRFRPDGAVRPGRVVPRAGSERPLHVGHPGRWYDDAYHRVLVLRWPVFVAGGALLYLLVNLVFAALYLLRPDTIAHARPGSFADAFFFSVQTISTIGYGVLTPSGTYANLLVTAETLVSLVFLAFTTGLIFSRFARPTARVAFSQVAVISTYNGQPTLFVRLSNSRRNQILEADVRMSLLRTEPVSEGGVMRRFYDLAMSRTHTPIFSLTFTAMHPITEGSPFHGVSAETLAAADAELLVTVTGLDETMSQTIHARCSYIAEEILFGHRFEDMFGYTDAGRLVIDHTKLSAVEPVRP